MSVSPAASTITVRVGAEDPVALHVLDEGPGLTEEDCVHAFERFWRGSSATDGTGLGLAIVAGLARASGGSAALTPRVGGGPRRVRHAARTAAVNGIVLGRNPAPIGGVSRGNGGG